MDTGSIVNSEIAKISTNINNYDQAYISILTSSHLLIMLFLSLIFWPIGVIIPVGHTVMYEWKVGGWVSERINNHHLALGFKQGVNRRRYGVLNNTSIEGIPKHHIYLTGNTQMLEQLFYSILIMPI